MASVPVRLRTLMTKMMMTRTLLADTHVILTTASYRLRLSLACLAPGHILGDLSIWKQVQFYFSVKLVSVDSLEAFYLLS